MWKPRARGRNAKMIIRPRFDTIRNTWVQEPQPIPSSVFWNGEYELVHPLGWVEGAEGSISTLAAILTLLPITNQFQRLDLAWPLLFIPYFWWDNGLELSIKTNYKGNLDDLHHNPCVPVPVDTWRASCRPPLQEHDLFLQSGGVIWQIWSRLVLSRCLRMGSSTKYLGVQTRRIDYAGNIMLKNETHIFSWPL